MADIELVIKIPEEKYNYVKKQVAEGINNPLKAYIANGTLLPKGHGRLIDRDALRESMNGACMGVMAGSDDYDTPLKILDSATVVIEADRSEKR